MRSVPSCRMLEVGEEAARDVLLGLEQLGGREDRAERDALGLRRGLDLGARPVGEPRRDDGVELGDVLAPAGAGVELGIAKPGIADQRPRRGPLRHGVDDRDVAVAAGHDLELGVLALAAGRDAGRLGARCRLPVHPLQHFGERHADRGGACPASRAASAAVRPVKAVRPAAYDAWWPPSRSGLRSGSPTMCSRPLSASSVNSLTGRAAAFISTGKAAISIGVARPARASGAIEAAPRTAPRRRSAGARRDGPSGLREVERHRALRGVEELEQRALALRQKGGARRTGSPPAARS